MKIELTDKEREIIECAFDGWDKSDDRALYGGISERNIYELCKKLNIEVPNKTQRLIDGEDPEKVLFG